MKHRIGESGADIDVLLERLAGEERAGVGEIAGKSVVAILIGIGLPVFLAGMLLRERTYDTTWWIVAAVAVMAPFAAAGLVVNTMARYVVARDSIARQSPFGIGSWEVHRSDIHALDLEISHAGPVLHVVSRSGRSRAIPLLPGFHTRLSELYPEIGTPGAQVRLSPRLGRILYVLLGLVVAAFLLLLFVLAEKG